MKRSPALKVTLIAVCAALYAVLGYASYLGIFAPVIGVVRFWPPVFVPATFAVTFDPIVGGLGAAIGIFISDMLIHGNALLSLIAGVPANFLCFFIAGLGKRRKSNVLPCIGVNLIMLVLCLMSPNISGVPWPIAVVYSGAVLFSLTVASLLTVKAKEWSSFYVFASLGLLIGSVWIGITVWLFSQFFILPSGESRLPLAAALAWMIWVYATEIPFMLLITPPVVSALRKAGLWWEE
ncbi:MAG: hypothetical protein J7L11_04535 [Thermoprotei archaeon]|nr:hypothetical protein [Thermoprotei archaeon]